jgi:hypothetical protein
MALALLAALLTGCATTKVDWVNRVGNYTYDQAVVELGPPDKYARLSDGATVAEWLTQHGYTTVAPYGFAYYYPWGYGGFYPGYVNSYTSPNYYLRLIFGPDNVLRNWKRFSK